uniref:H0701F11.3 protein n=1 Tax=Oryza sativa TaxID=4530 RepID=Q259L3_ORYSA|nr:H0723C07.16 [Oryza sativa]CAJ86137.1 H0701F11.3 [Oryza sativa]
MAAAAAAAPNGNSNGNHHGLQGDVSVTYLYIECCYGTAVGTGTARYQNPGRWIWPDPTASRVWYRAVPILSLCSTTRRTEVEGQKRNFVCNNRIGRDGRAARTLEVLRFSIDRRRRCLLDRRRRLLEDDIDATAAGKDDIDATATGNDEFATAAACFNAAVAGKDEFDAAAAIRVLDETIRRLEQLFRFTQADNPGPAVLLRIIGRINRANTRRSTLFAQLHTYIRRRRRRHHQQQAPPSPPAGGNIASNGNGAAINNGNSNNAAAGAPPADA